LPKTTTTTTEITLDLTEPEADYLDSIATGTDPFTASPSPLAKVITKLVEAVHEEYLARAHEAAREEHLASEDGLWHPLHDTTEEADGLR
jgi:hypothetical protein